MHDIERKLRDLGERTSERVRYGEVPRGRIVRRARLRRGLVVGAPVVAAVLLAALVFPRLDLPGRDGEDRVVELAAVASATEGAGTARIEIEMISDIGDDPRTIRGIGVVDFENVRSRVFMEQTGYTQRMEIVSVGSSVFMRILDEDGVGQPQWYETEMPDGAVASPALGGDPSDFLAYLKGVSHDVTDLGEETLDGVPVTHYRAEMEVPDFGASAPGGEEFDLEPMDVWVDEEGRLRRFTFGATSDGAGSMHMDMRLWDFGTPVEIEAPDPDDVTDPSPYSGQGSVGNEIGSGGAVTMIMGEGRIDTPYVEVDTQDPRIIEACVHSPRPVTSATLVHKPSGRLVFVFSPVRSDGHFTGPLPVACVEHPITHADVEALIEEPTEFTLSVERSDGSNEIVKLTTTASSSASSTAVE